MSFNNDEKGIANIKIPPLTSIKNESITNGNSKGQSK